MSFSLRARVRRWRRRSVAAVLFVLIGAAAKSAFAEPPAAGEEAKPPDDDDKMPPPGYLPAHRERVSLGLSPHAPALQSVVPGGLMPPFAAPVRPADGYKFDFHGYLQAGGRVGFGSRKDPNDDQSSMTWHGDPVVPRGNVFENSNTVPYTWAELRFSYSIPSVTATVSLGAWSLSESMQAAGSFMPNAQLWVRDAFLTYVPKGLDPVKLTWNVGVYEDRYGNMAEYSSGQYGAPLIATVAGVGETLSIGVPLGAGFEVNLEHGIKTQLDRPFPDAPAGPANNWPKPWEGQTFVNHLHLGFNIKNVVRPALHWISAFARDDIGDNVPLGNLRAGYQSYSGSGLPDSFPALDHADGSLQILAADVRFSLQRFGYLYTGVSRTSADHIRTVSNVVQVLNAGGGRDLMDRYFGRSNDQGTGTLLLAGAEYSLSLGQLLRYPEDFWGEGPDLRLTVYGLYGHITSDDPSRDGEDKYKFGVEGTYSMLPWLAAAARFDRAVPYVNRPATPIYPNQNDNSYSVLTLKAIFRSGWQSRETLTLQYSTYFYRSGFHLVTLNSGGQISTQSDSPDQHLLALYGTLWW